MTKEEILDPAFKKYREGEADFIPISAFYSAMDEYAKQHSMAFLEWASINGWYLNKIKRWSNRNESSDNLIDVLSATKTTEELYSLFNPQH